MARCTFVVVVWIGLSASAASADDLASRFPELMLGATPHRSTGFTGVSVAATPNTAASLSPGSLSNLPLVAPLASPATDFAKAAGVNLNAPYADLIGSARLTPATTGRLDSMLRSQTFGPAETGSLIRSVSLPTSNGVGSDYIHSGNAPIDYVRSSMPGDFTHR